MGRYSQSSYENEDEPPFWVKALLVLALTGAVSAGLWVAKHWPW